MTSDEKDLQLSDITDNLISELDSAYLPSNYDVLRRLLFEIKTKESKVSNAAETVIDEVSKIWKTSLVTVRRNDKCIEKLKKLHESYRNIKKFNNRKTAKVTDFLKKLTDLFDISHNDFMKLLVSMDDSVEEDFLLHSVDYLKAKLSTFETFKLSDEDTATEDNVDISNQSSFPKAVQSEKKPNLLVPSSTQQLNETEFNLEILNQSLSQNAVINDDGADDDANIVLNVMTRSKALMLQPQQSSSEETCPSSQSQGSGIIYNIAGRNYESKNDRGTIDVMTPNVVAAFGKAKVSDRDAVFITALISDALNVDVNSLILNRKSISAARAKIRKQEYEKMKKLIKEVPVAFLTVHWDGKLISDAISCKKVDRLPILVSSDKFTKLINVPALQDQKARTIALAVYAALKDWGLLDLVESLCCDTTNVNLGAKGGAAFILEQEMNKDLLYLPCRRHMFEILLRAAFEQKFPGTSGPDVSLFKRFRDEWYTFDLKSFENGLAELDTSLKNEVPFVVDSIKRFLKEQQPRSDYKELLEISLIFLGVKENLTFKKPGAVHHARWMSKAIYSIKIYLFREAFKLSKADQAKLYAVCEFIVFRYLKTWYTASSAISAPNNDLKLIKSLIDFKDIDKSISDATLHKLRNHLWYLSPELSVLSLFDTDVDISTKKKIVESLEKQPLDEESDSKKYDPSDEGIRALGDKSLDYFTNSQSLNLFSRLKLNTSFFLKRNCSKWEDDESYIECREKLKHLVVVNDCAERAVHLTEEYINTGSVDEDQKQYLLQFIAESRQNILASSDKKKLVKKLKTE